MKYDILCSESIDELIKQVNKKLQKGWEIQGGISVLAQGVHYKVFYQVIIKK